MRRATIAFLLALFTGVPSTALAQCAGFSDVSPFGNPFCTNVQWMKNRAITLGCTATTYCPDDPVNRLQMAAFMNRVGNVLTPRVLSIEASGGALSIVNQNFLCQTPDVAGVDYNREVHADASFSWDADAAGDLALSFFVSRDGGMTWELGSLNDFTPLFSIGPGGRQQASVTLERKEAFLGFPGDTSRFALRVTRGGQNTNAALTSWACHVQVVVTTRAE